MFSRFAISVAPSPSALSFLHLYLINGRLVHPGLGLGDTFKLTLAPQVGSNSAKTPSISRKHFPAAVLVSIGCSVALRLRALGLKGADDVLQIADRAR